MTRFVKKEFGAADAFQLEMKQFGLCVNKRALPGTWHTSGLKKYIGTVMDGAIQKREAFQEFAAQMRKVVVLVAESAAAAFGALNEALMQLTACTAESMAAAWEEMMKLAEQDDDLLDQEQEDRHDGATVILTIWLPPVPSLKKLYGQGVDYGGLAHPSGADPPRR